VVQQVKPGAADVDEREVLGVDDVAPTSWSLSHPA
jgi:hypothetical protein